MNKPLTVYLSRKPMSRKTPAIYAVEGNSHMPIVYLKRSKYATDEQYEAILKMFENE